MKKMIDERLCMVSVALLVGCFGFSSALALSTVYVSAEYGNDETGAGTQASPVKTIQAGVNMLTSGYPSYMWISNGVYKLDAPVVFNDQGGQNYCIVRSMSGNPADVVIDGQNTVRCIHCKGYNTQFHGITVENGYATDGYAAGFYLGRTGFVVSNCVVRNCHSISSGDTNGGGFYSSTKAKIMDTLFADCSAESTGKGAFGGAFMAGYSYNETAEEDSTIRNVTVSNCAVRSATSPFGGGAYINRANVNGLVVIDCVASNTTVSPTEAKGYGGGVFKKMYITNTFENVFITNCVSTCCGAGFSGSGASGGRLIMRDCTFAGNTLRVLPVSKTGYGGGAYLQHDYYEVSHSRFSGNRIISNASDSSGGGVRFAANSSLSDSVIEGNSIVGGDLSAEKGYGGGVYTTRNTISNCVIAANSANVGGGFYLAEAGTLLTDIFCVSNSSYHASIGNINISGSNKDPSVIRNSYFTRNGGESRQYFGSLNVASTGVNTPVSLEHCTFVSNCLNSTAAYVVCPSSDNPNSAIATASASNFFVKGCVFSANSAKFSTFPNSMNPVTNITYTYADSFRVAWMTDVAELRNYNMGMMPGGARPVVDEKTDHRLKPGMPLVNAGIREDWMGSGRKNGPLDMGDGSYSIVKSGKYGVSVLRNNALPRLSGSAPDYGCFEFPLPKGMVLSFR